MIKIKVLAAVAATGKVTCAGGTNNTPLLALVIKKALIKAAKNITSEQTKINVARTGLDIISLKKDRGRHRFASFVHQVS